MSKEIYRITKIEYRNNVKNSVNLRYSVGILSGLRCLRSEWMDIF